ncbi:hypothetical protein VNO80_27900 [Phaseolus coccineus]|uniref:Uncharacterized protein n=1 Tax=Phaseolus coccineus TaxID=3886 RepID=A0AAN9LKG7_PHACN
MSQATFTEDKYLCLAISVLVGLYVFLLALDSPWTNKRLSLILQDCSFPILTETSYVITNSEEGMDPGSKLGKP